MRAALLEAREEAHQLLRKRESRSPWQPLSVLNCTFWPLLLYAYVYCLTSGILRFHHFWIAFLLGPLPGLVVCGAAAWLVRGRLRRAETGARSLLVLALCLWLALGWGLFSGDRNYHWYMSSYYGYQDLASYTDIDPSADMGQSYMDAGQMYFREGSKVERKDMMAFKSDSTYCVAPITSQPLWASGGTAAAETGGAMSMPPSGTVDFWAVGMDCCSSTKKDFSCGHADDPRARSGLRLLRDDARPFYLLAVQEWVSKNCPVEDNTESGRAKTAPLICLPARHPLFFYWVRDPIYEVDQFSEKASRLFGLHTALFCAGDLALALVLLWLLAALGLK